GSIARAAVICRHDVLCCSVLRAIVCGDSGSRHAANAIGRDLNPAIRADADRAGHRTVTGWVYHRSIEPFAWSRISSLCPRPRRPDQLVGGVPLHVGPGEAAAGCGGHGTPGGHVIAQPEGLADDVRGCESCYGIPSSSTISASVSTTAA